MEMPETEADPRGWSIDQVVQQLCQNPTPLWSTADQIQLIPDRTLLENALRQNHVDGDTLLALDMATLKDDLGIASFGQRRAIIKAIEFFRSHSRSYQQLLFRADNIARMQSANYVSPQITQPRMSIVPQSPAYLGLGIQPSVEPRIPPRSPSLSSAMVQQGIRSIDQPAFPSLDPAPTPLPDPFNTIRPSSGPQPTLHVPSGREEISTTKVVEWPRKECTIIKGKKKVAPTFVSQLPGSLPIESTDGLYLSRDAVPLQDVFYYKVPTDIDDVFYRVPTDDSEDFVLSGCYPNGKRRFIARQFKFFLRQGTMTLPQSGSRLKLPYRNTHINSPYSKQLFTLFPQGGGRARVHNIEDYPELRNVQQGLESQSVPMQAGIGMNPLPGDPTTTTDGRDHSDWTELDYLLDKYPVQDSDEGLPFYGDSGDEGAFDEETLREIQEEADEKSREPLTMTRTEAEATIDEAIEEMKREWRDTKLAKVQLKAYRIWMRAAKAKNRQPEIYYANGCKDHFKSQRDKIKKEMLAHIWRDAAELKKQCQSIEQTIFQYEEFDYRSRSILQETPPERPSPESLNAKRPRSRQILEDGEELLESESEAMMEESEDDGLVDDSSEAGSIHHEPDAEYWNPELPVSTSAGGRHLTTNDRLPAPSGPAPDNQLTTPDEPADDADIDSDTGEDEIVTPARNNRRQAKAKADSKALGPEDLSSSPTPIQQRPTYVAESDSDLDRSPRLPKSKYQDQGRSMSTPVDLTYESPGRGDQTANDSSGGSIATPPLNPVDLETPKRLKSAKVKKTPLLSDLLDDTGLPSYEDVQGMMDISWADIEVLDKRRALAKAVYHLEPQTVNRLTAFLNSLSSSDSRKSSPDARNEVVFNGLLALDADDSTIPGINAEHQRTAHLLVLLYVTYACGQNMLDHSQLSASSRDNAFADKDIAVPPFYQLLNRLMGLFLKHQIALGEHHSRGQKRKRDQGPFSSPELEDDSDSPTTDYMSTDGVEEIPPPPSSHKKRKRKVEESQQAINMQLNDRLRMQEQERRRQAMAQKLGQVQINGEADDNHIVNTTEPYVHLDPHIAQRVKPHQMHGIQFMWREIVDDVKHQGCILAHTMGLGKTMQVISLLVTISQCNQSQDPQVRGLIPEHLRKSKTLILCPASLLENWLDELLLWTPHNTILGEIYKCSGGRPENTLNVKKWSTNGGVLLLSYGRFRSFTSGTAKANGERPTDLERILLDEPNLVIADEAHTLKNSTSLINQCARRLKPLSRIALTGSPLNNHLEEYHAIVDWIAPNYLGDIVQFRAKYSDPINAGLYFDSSPSERRFSLRKLHVLNKDLDPKINRADISVIEKDMPTKTEYFITIPLTDLQRQAYDIYVTSIVQSFGASGGTIGSTKILQWASMLGWLCHHPTCFLTKLKRLEKQGLMGTTLEATTNGETSRTDIDDGTDEALTPEVSEDVQLDATGPLSEALQQIMQLFRGVDVQGSLSDPAHSYRTLAVKCILEKAITAGDKTLIFSHSIPTLDYLEGMLKDMKCSFCRLDGKTKPSTRQAYTKEFNQADSFQQVFLISMKAGGLGLNLQGANRVIIFDFSFNPTWEQQAIGRAFRLNQKRPVFVYRFQAGGTFEDVLFNTTVFKTQLFGRVVDKKKPLRHATKKATHYLFPVKPVLQQDFSDCLGKDPKVLDAIIDRLDCIRSIVLTETFQKEDDEQLDDEEQKAAEEEYADQRLRRDNYDEWLARHSAATRAQQMVKPALAALSSLNQVPSSTDPGFGSTRRSFVPPSSQPTRPVPPFDRQALNNPRQNGTSSPTSGPREYPDGFQYAPQPHLTQRRASSLEPDINMTGMHRN